MSDDEHKPWATTVYIVGPFFVVGVILLGLWIISHYLPLDWSELP